MNAPSPGMRRAPTNAGFGFQLRRVGAAWRWRAFDAHGGVSGEGVAETRATAAASIVRSLALAELRRG